MLKRTLMAAAAASIAVAAVPASGQVAGGLVTVQVADVDILRNSLNNNDVDILNNLLNNNQVAVPVNVQVPVGIAANVCGISVLAARQLTGPCTATTASGALGQAVSKQILKQRPAK